jgi:hypothetical protein
VGRRKHGSPGAGNFLTRFAEDDAGGLVIAADEEPGLSSHGNVSQGSSGAIVVEFQAPVFEEAAEGVLLEREIDLSRSDFSGSEFELEYVWQLGPLVKVFSGHGDYVFVSSSVSAGIGALGSKSSTLVWDTGLGAE